MTTQQNNTFKMQLEFLRMPCQVLDQDDDKASEPIQLPIQASGTVSAAKQAFLDMAAGPVMNLDDISFSECNYDSDPEILLSDSDEEDEQVIPMEDAELDADTVIDTNENLSSRGSEEDDFSNEDFDETLAGSVPSFNTNNFDQVTKFESTNNVAEKQSAQSKSLCSSENLFAQMPRHHSEAL